MESGVWGKERRTNPQCRVGSKPTGWEDDSSLAFTWSVICNIHCWFVMRYGEGVKGKINREERGCVWSGRIVPKKKGKKQNFK